jgi:sterol desaturase/sphingolipid hydroxylase (fatty acid hydroxylase superfamily)
MQPAAAQHGPVAAGDRPPFSAAIDSKVAPFCPIKDGMFVTVVVLALAFLMLVVERLKPGRDWPSVPAWWARAIAANLVQIGVVFLAGATWDGWMIRHRPWSADGLGLLGGALVGYVVITFLYYWWHRVRHSSDFLWRWFHQFHHSPQRIEIVTSFYKHPVELVANGLLSSFIAFWIVGLDRETATLAVTLTGIAELFYHWNVSTPYWVGFLIQRPESHLVHHQEGLHHYNYGDLPLWDMMFGTFHNPRQWSARCGFGDGEEMRLRELLSGRRIA